MLLYIMSSKNLDTRSRILESAWKLLEANKGKIVRMSDIAKQAGISRQAVYLHFPTRAEMLVATTQYVDEVKNIEAQLTASRTATSGLDRLQSFIETWGNYIPEIYGIGKALMAIQDTDEAAKIAWHDRMQAMREGCAAAVTAIDNDGDLLPDYTAEQATDILWTLLSVRNWEHFTLDCGWSQKAYVDRVTSLAQRMLMI